MKKRLFILLITALATTGLSAQQPKQRGIAWGADRDTVKYLIASPFDNWHVNVSAGVQTFIGNTPDPDAQWNSLDWSVRAELGKWIIPDFSISLRLGFSSVHSQSRHGGNNPWTDISNPINYANAEYGPYFPIKAYALTVMGLISVDWTNFFCGYEAGKNKKWHVCTPVGLGLAYMFGSIENPNYVDKVNTNNPNDDPIQLGDLSRNRELAFTGGVLTEFYATEQLSFNAALELLFARGSIDDYNYNLDKDERRVDFMPSLHVGVRFNILSHIRKYHPDTKIASRDSVYHEFISVNSSNTVKTLNGKIERLKSEKEDALNNSTLRGYYDSILIDSLNHALTNAKNLADHYKPDSDYQPLSLTDELLDLNTVLNLPYTVVFFELDKYYLDYNARKKLQTFAKEVSELPDTIEFYMIGAADSLTGTITHNQWLSKQRCEATFNMLTQNYGLSGNQLIQVYAGGINDMQVQEDNRMTLVIQRTPVTEEIVERWLRMSRERLQKEGKRGKR